MNKLMRRALRPLAALAVVGLAGACGDDPGAAPDAAQESVVASSFGTALSPGMDVLRRSRALEEDQSVTRLVKNSTGEWLDIESAGIRVHLPAGALGDDPNAEMDVTLVAKAGDNVTWHIEPHGLELSQPVTVLIRTSNTNASHLQDRNTPSGPTDAVGVSWQPSVDGTEVLIKSSVYYSESGYLIFQTVHAHGLITL